MSLRVVRWRFCSASKSMLRNFRTISTLKKTCWHQNTGISIMLVAVNLYECCKINNLMISYVLLIKSVITYLTSINILKLWMDLPTKLTNNDVKIFFMKPKYMLHVERFITSSLTNTFIHASKNTSSTQCQGNIRPCFILHNLPLLNLWLGKFLGLKLSFFNHKFSMGEFRMGRNHFQWRSAK